MSNVLSRQIANWIQERLAQTGRCGIAFPGGRSPIALMHSLRVEPLDWTRVDVTLVDERAVDSSAEASNARLVQSEFLVDRASHATFHPLHIGQTAQASAQALNAGSHPLPDIAVLGFGEDGHFASIFPGEMVGFESDEAFFATPPLGQPCVQRISMTWRAINDAKYRVLLASTEAKADLLHRVCRESVRVSCPLSVLAQAERPTWVQWPNGELERLERVTPG